jgi:hypothetical protein
MLLDGGTESNEDLCRRDDYNCFTADLLGRSSETDEPP